MLLVSKVVKSEANILWSQKELNNLEEHYSILTKKKKKV